MFIKKIGAKYWKTEKKNIFLKKNFISLLLLFFIIMPYPGLLGHRAMPYRGIYRRGATHTYGIPGPTQATGL